MKLVTFAVDTPTGRAERLGALLDGRQDGRIVDLTAAYATYPARYRWPPYYKGNPDAVYGPEDPIPYPSYTQKLDLEIEIGIVVGREGRNLTVEQAREAIAGYTIFIDCSARDGQEREPFGPAK